MFRTEIVAEIARRQLDSSWRDRTLHWLGGSLVCLAILSLLVCSVAHRRDRLLAQNLQDTVRQQWLDQPDRHPHRVAHYGAYAFRPTGALGFFDRGVSSFAGKAIFLEAHVQNPANFASARESSAVLRFGELTPAFILQLLVPLLLIFLGSRAVSSEREAATLAMIKVQAVSAREFLVGKAVGVALAAALLLVPVMALTLLVLMALNGSDWTLELLQRLGLLGLAYGLYLAGWILLSVGLAGRQVSSSHVLAQLLGLWILLGVFLPRALPSVGEWLHPAPTRVEFETSLHQEVVAGGHGHNPNDPHFDKQRAQLLKRYGVEKVEDLPVNFRGVAMREGEQHSSETYQKHLGELQQIYQRQNSLSQVLALADPYLAIREFSAGVCGSDYRHQVDFERQAENFRVELIQGLNELHIHEISYEGDKQQKLSSHHWQQLPTFRYVHPSLAWAMSAQSAGIGGLLLWLAGTWWLVWRGRVEVRA